MEEVVHDVPTVWLMTESEDVITTSESGLDSEAETETSSIVSSVDTEPPTYKLSLINILEMSDNLSTSDLEAEQEDIMSQTLSSISSQHERANKAQKIENIIRSTKEHKADVQPSSQRPRFSTSPCHNASRFCRKPKERTTSEGGTPHHSPNGNHNIRIESPCQVSVTSLNANISLPMDRLSTKLFNPQDRSYTSLGVSSPRRIQNGSSCFGGRARIPRQFVIHPDWVSESLSIGKAPLTDRGGQDFLDYIKRSQSCPPPMRNVITWDNKYNPPVTKHVNGAGR